jgi:hypothetical protein
MSHTEPTTGRPLLSTRIDRLLVHPVFEPMEGEGVEEEEGDVEEDEDEWAKSNRPLWRYRSDRKFWRSDLLSAKSYSHISLCALIFHQRTSSAMFCSEPKTLSSVIERGLDDDTISSNQDVDSIISLHQQGSGGNKKTGQGPKFVFSSTHSAIAAAAATTTITSSRSVSGFSSSTSDQVQKQQQSSLTSSSSSSSSSFTKDGEDHHFATLSGGKKRGRPGKTSKSFKKTEIDLNDEVYMKEGVDGESDEITSGVLQGELGNKSTGLLSSTKTTREEGKDGDDLTEDEGVSNSSLQNVVAVIESSRVIQDTVPPVKEDDDTEDESDTNKKIKLTTTKTDVDVKGTKRN